MNFFDSGRKRSEADRGEITSVTEARNCAPKEGKNIENHEKMVGFLSVMLVFWGVGRVDSP